MSHTSINSDNAVLLLAAASELGLDKSVVRQRRGNFTAPDEVFEKAGFSVDKDTGYATAAKRGKASADSDTTKKTAAKKVAARTTPAKAEKEN